jgi:predicted small secreted protein
MIKKRVIFFSLLVFIVLNAGCETLKGAATGAFEGAKKDWEVAKKVDNWMRENLW